MKTVLVLMVLLGCDCDGIECEYVRTVSSVWTSIETCQAAIDRKVAAEKASYPLLTARCAQEPLEDTPDNIAQADAISLATSILQAGSDAWSFGAARKHVTVLAGGSLASVRNAVSWIGGLRAGEQVRRFFWP